MIAESLISNGMDKATKIAVIERGFRKGQRVTTATLETITDIASDIGIRPPAIIVIGEVVRLYRDGSEGTWAQEQ